MRFDGDIMVSFKGDSSKGHRSKLDKSNPIVQWIDDMGFEEKTDTEEFYALYDFESNRANGNRVGRFVFSDDTTGKFG